MTINYDDDYDVELGFNYIEIADDVIRCTLDYEHFPYEAEVGISLVGEEEIRRLNYDYRSIDSVTDVLSFPMIDYSTFNLSETRSEFIIDDRTLINPESGEVLLGDIVLCIPRMISQANEYGHSVLREYAFLITHSMLHLLGYDHMTDSERLSMEDKQRSILSQLEISRDS